MERAIPSSSGPEPRLVCEAACAAAGAPILARIAPADGESGATLGAYWRLVSRYRWTLAIISFTGAVAALLLTLQQTPVYEARASLELQGLNQKFLNIQEVSPTAEGSDPESAEGDIQAQLKILRSQTLLERVVDKLGKARVAEATLGSGRVSTWRKLLRLAVDRPDLADERIMAALTPALDLRAEPNSRLIEIRFESPDARFAADFVNRLTEECIEQNLESRWRSAEHTGQWLARQMEDLKTKVGESERQLQDYARRTGLVITGENDNVADLKLRQLQEELGKAQAERVARQSRYESAATAPPETLGEVLDSASLKEYQARLTDLRRQLADLSSVLTPEHPKVERLGAQVATLEQALGRERSNILRRIRNDFESALRRETLLADAYARQEQLLVAQADRVTQYNMLKREVDTNRQLYQTMLQRVREAGVASALRASNIRIIDPARAPRRPSKPQPLLNVTLGLLAGLVGGLMAIMVREQSNRTLQRPGDVAEHLRLTELGVIPSVTAAGIHGRRQLAAPADQHARRREADRALSLPMWYCQNSMVSDSFRAVLTSILFARHNGSGLHTLLISSANVGEGKTTVASNLAVGLTRTQESVLLVDGDLRRPSLHRIFGVSNECGLAECLAGEAPLTVLATSVPKLFLLPAGHFADADLIYGNGVAELFRRLRLEFPMIVIDSPPVITLPDARVFARHADAVILVVRANRTTRDAAAIAQRRFTEDGTRILGSILNDWNPARDEAYGYERYCSDNSRYYGAKA